MLVAACSQRKRAAAPPELTLASIDGAADERIREWRRRLARVPAPRLAVSQTYAGDHWHATKNGAGRELAAGYGLISSSKKIKAYSATFAVGNPDSVWRGVSDGRRPARLQGWWRKLNHEATLEELLPGGDGALLIAAGAAYLTAVDGDLEHLLGTVRNEETVSVISAGTRGDGALLPVSGGLRGALGGTDSALNARTLRLLAATAGDHQFRHSEMKRLLERLSRTARPTVRQNDSWRSSPSRQRSSAGR